MSPFDLSVLFFLQMAVILGACRLTGALFRRLGQSQVVSEMVAGVLLGPTLLGWLLPGAHARLFPPQSLPILFSVSQVGLVLYMFLVGLELDLDMLRSRARGAAAVSAAGILAPFLLGWPLALHLSAQPGLFAPSVTPFQAALFLGAAISVTAFPMLARIIVEQGLARTPLGTLALAAGAIDDAAAWSVLAVVLASFAGTPLAALSAVGGGALFALLCAAVLRPLLAPLGRRVEREGLDPGTLALLLMLVMLGAWVTDSLRIYAVFGAFLTGTAMPRGRLARELKESIHPLVASFLLPVFFVYSGLNTRLALVIPAEVAIPAATVLLAAFAAKGGACYLAARLLGEPHREALGVGILMNARGLMELILVNIGLERGLIAPPLFAILVLMAVVTTLAATPLFERFHGRPQAPSSPAA